MKVSDVDMHVDTTAMGFLFFDCRHLRAVRRCMYGSEKVTAALCEAYDSVRHGQELALDFICDDGYSGITSRLV